jgi:hypothetical protein
VRCIYCLEDSSGTRGRAHALPEAVTANNAVLPLGAVCDSCNEFLGGLDNVMVSYPALSLVIQRLKLPGKLGKPRRRVGNVEILDGGKVAIQCDRPVASSDSARAREFTARILVDRNFKLLLFRRALHHVGLNTVALTMSPEEACESRYDAVRNYVRKARPLESWPFLKFENVPVLLSEYGREIFCGLYHAPFEGCVRISVCDAVVFAVDLLNSESLPGLLNSHFPSGAEIMKATDHMPRSPKQGRHRYRLLLD